MGTRAGEQLEQGEEAEQGEEKVAGVHPRIMPAPATGMGQTRSVTAHTLRSAVVLLVLALLIGCPVQEEAPPPLPVAHCGMATYEALPAAGRSVYAEKLDAFDLTAGGLDALLEVAGHGALTPVPNGVVMYRYRYTTQDRGLPVEATGMIAVPGHLAAAPTEPWPVALLLHGYAGAWDACAPSADDMIGPAVPALLASQGFAVVAPDYIGMAGTGAPSTAPHAPLVGEQVAIGAWDALRAGLELLRGELASEYEGSLRDDVVIWGASQGGHAAFFVELAGPYYGAEFTVAGVVAASPAHDQLSVVADALDHYSDSSGLAALALVGMWRWYGVPDDLLGLLTNEEPYFFADAVVELLEGAGDECEFELDFEVEVDEVEDIYTPGFISSVRAGDWDAVTPWSCFLRENSPSSSSIERLRETPVLTVYGQEDTLVVPSLQEADFATLCGQGWQLQQLQCQGAPHAETTLWSLDEQVAWLRQRLAGEELGATCGWTEPVCCSASPEDVCL
jgi:dienelactone hydrolase